VNSGGIFPLGATVDAPADQIDDVFAINVRAPYLLVLRLPLRWPNAVTARSST
jgi:NAD(P)-dependent dehydrogenase (short-subunit alcohol dehydrogenase family)